MNEFKPTRKQTEFLTLPYDVKEALYGGAVHSGKTDILLLYPILHKFHENPKFKGLFLRRTYGELELEVIPRSKIFYKAINGTWNGGVRRWEFPSGAIIFFGHLEQEDDVHKYDSFQPNYVAFDELTSFTQFQYLYITIQRCRTQLGNPLPAIVRSGSNPGNIGHLWVKKRFVDPSPNGKKLIVGPTGMKRVFIPATVYDNPHTHPDYIKGLESIPDRAERDAKLHGKWDSFEGSVFNEFRERAYPDEPSNALHVIEPFDIPDFWPKIVAIDWGFKAWTWVGFIAISPKGQCYLYRELAWKEKKISEWAGYVKECIEQDNPKLIKLCRSAGQDRGQEHTIEQQISVELGRNVDLTGNVKGSRVSGKQLLHEYLRWKPKYHPVQNKKVYDEEYALKLLRTNEKEYHSYIDSFAAVPEEVLPKLLIFNECKLTIEAIKACVYDKTNPEDVAAFEGDDAYDGLRYLIDSADRYINESDFEFKKIQMREKLVAELNTSGNMTSFYRKAEKMEEGSYVMPVKRYHRAS